MSLAGVQQAIAAALGPLSAEIPDLQVYDGRNENPSPPSLDVYPGDPFQVGAGFGVGEKLVFFTVRARVSKADQDSQKLLLRLLDSTDPASVEAAIAVADAGAIGNDGYVSGFRDDTDGLLSCEWRVEVFL